MRNVLNRGCVWVLGLFVFSFLSIDAAEATSCKDATLNWGAGPLKCSGKTGKTLSIGSTITVSNQSPGLKGEAVYKCASRNSLVAAGSFSCAPSECKQMDLSWSEGFSKCSANTGRALKVDEEVVLENKAPGFSGTAKHVCRVENGVAIIKADGASTCNPSECKSEVLNWAQGKLSCSAQSGTRKVGEQFDLNNTAAGLAGAAKYSCSLQNGAAVFQAAAGASCSPAECKQTDLTWSFGLRSSKVSCSQNTGKAIAVGEAVVLENKNQDFKGTAKFVCRAENGVALFKSDGVASCKPAGCKATSVSWVEGSGSKAVTCKSATTSTVEAGTEVELKNTTFGLEGSAKYKCEAGSSSASLKIVGKGSCKKP